MKLFFIIPAAIALLVLVLLLLRLQDSRADQLLWAHLRALQPANPVRFDPAIMKDLPGPARRFFEFAIMPGTPLLPIAEIDMNGQFSLGTRDDPGYRTMEANQILASPHGFVWQLRLPGWLPVSGSDGGSGSKSWTRFRIFGLIPVARLGGDSNHLRSAYGRYVAEAVFWTPAALLPGQNVTWESVDENTARVTMATGSMSQTVDVTVNARGQPVSVAFMRWSDANPDKEYRYQPFGGKLSDFREVRGYRLPFRVEAGNMFGTNEYFPFYRAEVTEIRFPTTSSR